MAGAAVENGNVNGNSNGVSTEVLGESTWWESEGAVPADHDSSVINRNWFPSDFLFGTGTAAYQVELLMGPMELLHVRCTIDTSLYELQEDIKKMKQMGFTSYRFSISWPRILPAGRVAGGVKQEGIDFYNDLINTLLEHDITPFVTLFHWDLPASLDKEYGGFLSKKIRKLTYKLKGYSVWAWCDTYEWYSGYTIRFGLNYVDFANDYQRYPKNSAAWFAKFLHDETMPPKYFQPLWLQAKPESEKEKEKSSVSEEDLEIKLAKGAKLIVGYN